ncbi:glycoside hydrolase family 43 protein [Nocardioides ultimimeridianus]
MVVALVLGCSLLLGTPAEGSGRHSARRSAVPAPVLRGHAFGDPAVVSVGSARIMVATGEGVVRGTLARGARHWHWESHALRRLPRWAAPGPVWGPDLARIGRHHWVLYFAARVRGLGAGAHCIGTAISRSPYGRFQPTDRRPLVCQAGAHAPRAYDLARVARHLPRRGVIDPSYFRDRRGRSYLLYKTAGRPSTIRIVPLARGGLARRPHTHSVALVRSGGIVENPAMVRRGRHYYLFTSEGVWSSCGYHEMWRASRLLRSWGGSGHTLLTRRSTHGLCGPGGADVAGPRHRQTVYFHGWVRRGTGQPLRSSRYAGRGSRRAMYAARLRWRHGRPTIHGYAGR